MNLPYGTLPCLILCVLSVIVPSLPAAVPSCKPRQYPRGSILRNTTVSSRVSSRLPAAASAPCSRSIGRTTSATVCVHYYTLHLPPCAIDQIDPSSIWREIGASPSPTRSLLILSLQAHIWRALLTGLIHKYILLTPDPRGSPTDSQYASLSLSSKKRLLCLDP